MRRGEQQPSDLNRPDGNDLKPNYDLHDIGHRYVAEQLPDAYTLTEWGIDMRDDDGDGGIIYDDKMDFRVWYDDKLFGLIDVKTKRRSKWMGLFNERHYSHYYDHAIEFDVPTFVVMLQVDYDTDKTYDGFVFEVSADEKYDNVLRSSESTAVSRFPDGNEAVLVPHEHRESWRHLEAQLAMTHREIDT